MEAKDANVVTDTCLRPELWRMWRTAASMRGSACPTACNSCMPAVVSSTARVWRRNRGTPTSSSSDWICRLTADCVSAISSAAMRKLR